MLTKHFFKILILFTAMIAMGLIGIFLVSHFGEEGTQADPVNSQTQVAK
jgi:hypothetical protein